MGVEFRSSHCFKNKTHSETIVGVFASVIINSGKTIRGIERREEKIIVFVYIHFSNNRSTRQSSESFISCRKERIKPSAYVIKKLNIRLSEVEWVYW